MDVFFIEALVDEMAPLLQGARVNKIHQPEADELVLRLWNGREELRLLLSADSGRARLHLTTRSFPNPFTPPRFCQLLRARLARLVELNQLSDERIVRLDFKGPQGEDYRLMVELTGKHANLVLVDGQGRIVDALKRVEGAEGRRAVMPGREYVRPQQVKVRSLAGPLPKVPSQIREEDAYRRWLMDNIRPMSPLVARELAARVAHGKGLDEVLEDFRGAWLAKGFVPCIYTIDGKAALSAFRLNGLSAELVAQEEGFSQAADRFYYEQSLSEGRLGEQQDLLKRVKREIKRLQKRLTNILDEQQRLEDVGDQRRLGELLLAQLHLVKKGMSEVTLDDYFQDPPQQVRIELDPRLSPQENAQRYFKGFKKGRRGADHVQRRLQETEQDLCWLESVALALEEVSAPDDLLPIREELEEAGLIPPKQEPRSRKKTISASAGLRQATSPGGFVLYWGKNNKTNDYVSRQLCGPDDLWFHAHNIPGAHLVLKCDKQQQVSEEDLLYAAAIAAGHSRAGNDSKVEVMVAQGKSVRKPKGAKPGLVVVDRFRTVLVRPRKVG